MFSNNSFIRGNNAYFKCEAVSNTSINSYYNKKSSKFLTTKEYVDKKINDDLAGDIYNVNGEFLCSISDPDKSIDDFNIINCIEAKLCNIRLYHIHCYESSSDIPADYNLQYYLLKNSSNTYTLYNYNGTPTSSDNIPIYLLDYTISDNEEDNAMGFTYKLNDGTNTYSCYEGMIDGHYYAFVYDVLKDEIFDTIDIPAYLCRFNFNSYDLVFNPYNCYCFRFNSNNTSQQFRIFKYSDTDDVWSWEIVVDAESGDTSIKYVINNYDSISYFYYNNEWTYVPVMYDIYLFIVSNTNDDPLTINSAYFYYKRLSNPIYYHAINNNCYYLYFNNVLYNIDINENNMLIPTNNPVNLLCCTNFVSNPMYDIISFYSSNDTLDYSIFTPKSGKICMFTYDYLLNKANSLRFADGKTLSWSDLFISNSFTFETNFTDYTLFNVNCLVNISTNVANLLLSPVNCNIYLDDNISCGSLELCAMSENYDNDDNNILNYISPVNPISATFSFSSYSGVPIDTSTYSHHYLSCISSSVSSYTSSGNTIYICNYDYNHKVASVVGNIVDNIFIPSGLSDNMIEPLGLQVNNILLIPILLLDNPVNSSYPILKVYDVYLPILCANGENEPVYTPIDNIDDYFVKDISLVSKLSIKDFNNAPISSLSFVTSYEGPTVYRTFNNKIVTWSLDDSLSVSYSAIPYVPNS